MTVARAKIKKTKLWGGRFATGTANTVEAFTAFLRLTREF